MYVNQTFSPLLLNNYCDDPKKGLPGFVSGDKACDEINQLSVKYRNKSLPKTPYFKGIHATWITIKSTFESIFSIFCQSMAFLSYNIGLHKLGRIFTVLSYHCMRDWEQLCDQWRFDTPLLVPSFNVHQLTSWDIYKHGSIPLDDIHDEKVLSMTFKTSEFRAGVTKAMQMFYYHLEKGRRGQGWISSIKTWGETVSSKEKKQTISTFTNKYRENPEAAIEFLRKKYSHDNLIKPIEYLYTELKRSDAYVKQIDHLSLFSEHGLCRGASLWFIRLFYKTHHLFDTPHKHIVSLAEQFRTGIPKEAALIHGFHESEDLLQLQKEDVREHKISLYELDHDRESAKQKVNTIDPGVYRVGVYCHSFVFIKTDTQSYVWNPAFGLFEMSGEQMLDMILRYHYKPGDPDSQVYFHRYTSTQPDATGS